MPVRHLRTTHNNPCNMNDLYTRYGLTPPEPSKDMIEAFNDAIRGYIPPTPEDIERQRLAQEQWEKKSEFEKEFEERDGLIILGQVFDMELSEDLCTVTAEERCDNYHSCPMTKAEFQRLIDAMQNLCNKMKP